MLMIGIATEQNTTNLIPAIHFKETGENYFLCIATPRMGTYLESLENALKKSGIEHFQSIKIAESDEHSAIVNKIQSIINTIGYEGKIYWNIGGGQKKHTLILWEAFRSYQLAKNHSVCYVDPETKKIISYAYTNGELKETKSPENGSFEIEIELKDLVKLYSRNPNLIDVSKQAFKCPDGFVDTFSTIEERKDWFAHHRRIDEIGNLPNTTYTLEQIENLFKNQGLKTKLKENLLIWLKDQNWWKNERGFWNQLHNKFPSIINKLLGKEDAKSLIISTFFENKVSNIPPKPQGLGDYFEDIVVNRMQHLVKNNVHNLWRKVKIEENKQELVEFDVLIQTKQAQFIYFEAKTFAWTREEILAKLQNNRMAGGAYMNMVVVIPYFKEDIIEGSVYTEALMQLPFRLKEYRIKFCVVANPDDEPFWVYREKKIIHIATQEPESIIENDKVLCIPLEHYFKNPKNYLIS